MPRKSLSGTVVGVLIGVSLAVILARQGWWPADQLTLFLLPAVTGLIGMILLTVGREGSYTSLIVSLIILIPMLVWGALGVGKVGQSGELNGGCAVNAASAVDATTVTDTSRSDPFRLEADGPLSWNATSPTVFTDYDWALHVALGGIAVPIESATEPNEEGDLENGGEVPDVSAYAALRGIDLGLYVGVYEVGGFAATCDGFGFVRIVGEGFDPVTGIALAVLVLLIIVLVTVVVRGRHRVRETTTVISSGHVDADSPKAEDHGTEPSGQQE
jgi:hypothetical protein